MSVCVWTLRIFLILDCVKRNVWRVVVKWYNLCCRPSTTMSPLERLNSMSPAAQRLASKRLGVRTHTDSALRASYSPSPSRTPGDKTPVHLSPLPSGSSRSHAGMPASGPSPLRQSPRTTTPKPSLTDNLLKLPMRQSAADFFWGWLVCVCVMCVCVCVCVRERCVCVCVCLCEF